MRLSVDRFGFPAMAKAEPVTSRRRPEYSQPNRAVCLDIYGQSRGGGQTTAGPGASWFRIRDEEGWIRLARAAVRPPSSPDLPLLTLTGHELWRDGDDDGCGHLFVVLFPVPASYEAKFDSWFCEEHGPMLRRAKAWRLASLARIENGVFSRAAIHRLAGLDVLDGPERAAAAATTRTAAVMSASWTCQIMRYVATAATFPPDGTTTSGLKESTQGTVRSAD